MIEEPEFSSLGSPGDVTGGAADPDVIALAVHCPIQAYKACRVIDGLINMDQVIVEPKGYCFQDPFEQRTTLVIIGKVERIEYVSTVEICQGAAGWLWTTCRTQARAVASPRGWRPGAGGSRGGAA